ncbi:hypothetical protein PRSY57_0003400B, partial [Plasmodium reichenowi]
EDISIKSFLKNMLNLNLISYENILNIFLYTFYYLRRNDDLFVHYTNIYIKKYINLLNIMTFFVEFIKHMNKYLYIQFLFHFNLATLKLMNFLNLKIINIIKKYSHVKDLNEKYFIDSNDVVSGRHSTLYYFYFFVTHYNNYYLNKCLTIIVKDILPQNHLNRKMGNYQSHYYANNKHMLYMNTHEIHSARMEEYS